MKKIFLLILAIFLCIENYAQSPDFFNYQAVVRNSSGELVAEQTIGVQIDILKGSSTGTSIYSEIHEQNSNSYGQLNIKVGSGTTTDNINSIDWSDGTYFIQIKLDISGGTNYQLVGTSQILSVPYALHAKTAEIISETDPVFTTSQAANITSYDITNLNNLSGTNTGDQDLSSLAIQSALEDTASNIRNDFPDVSGFLTSETDPTFTSSQAANIKATDITNLSNLSGINTGDQDLSSLAIQSALEDTASDIRNDIPDVSSFITSETDPIYSAWNKNYKDLNNTPNIIDSVSAVLDTTTQFIKTEIDGDVTNEIQNLSEVLIQNNSANKQIKNLTDPTDDQDAVTKAYLENFLSEIGVLPLNYAGSIVDVDGNVYQTVTIGTQTWMADNLKTTKYNDGSEIPYKDDNTSWSELSPAYCWYDNDSINYADLYGALYNHYSVETEKLCPAGWHVPSRDEWMILLNYLNDNGYNYDGTLSTLPNKIGKSMAGITHWLPSTVEGAVGNTDYHAIRNTTNFSGMPGGYREPSGSFDSVRSSAKWWSTTNQGGIPEYWSFYLVYSSNSLESFYYNANCGVSIRCIKD